VSLNGGVEPSPVIATPSGRCAPGIPRFSSLTRRRVLG